MVWGSFAASGPDRLHVVEGMMSATKYCYVLEKVMLPSVKDLFVIDNKGCQQNIRMHLITPMALFRAAILISKSYI